jgi:hypothetical protein
VTGSSIISSSDTQIQANVSVAASAPSGTATIQVQSNGYTGNGFLSASPGQPSQATLNAVIQPIAPPPPQIMFYGMNVAQTTQSVYIGQQIALSVPTTNVSAGLTITSQSWTVPAITAAIGNYTASTASGTVAPITPTYTPTASTASTVTFYWVAQGSSQQISYTWSFNNGTSISASVTFNVGGPTGNLMLTANMPTDGSGVQILTNTLGPALSTTGVAVPGAPKPVGISFTSNATPPSGVNQSFNGSRFSTVSKENTSTATVHTLAPRLLKAVSTTRIRMAPHPRQQPMTRPPRLCLIPTARDGNHSARRCI